MGFTGKGFVGFIGVSKVVPPETLEYLGQGAQGGVNLTHTAPTGTMAGDRMMCSLSGYSLTGAQGVDGTVTPAAGWTEVANLAATTERQTFRLYTKIADANDEAGTSSYSWVMSAGGAAYGAFLCSTIPQANGTTITPATSDAGLKESFSAGSPGGVWLFAALMGKHYRTGGLGIASPVVTNPEAVLGASYSSNDEYGKHRHYLLPAPTTVTGTTGTSDYPYGGLIVVGVSR